MIDIQQLLVSMVEKNASDLYLTVGAPPLLRVDGSCHPVGENLKPADTRALCEFFMSEAQRVEFQARQEMNLAHSIPGQGRYRVNAFVQRGQAAEQGPEDAYVAAALAVAALFSAAREAKARDGGLVDEWVADYRLLALVYAHAP